MKRVAKTISNKLRERLKNRTANTPERIFKKYKFSRLDKNIYNLYSLYEEFMRIYKQIGFYKLFNQHQDPREQKTKWTHFETLYDLLMDEGINPKTYFFYLFKISSGKSYYYYFLSSFTSLNNYKAWESKLKAQGLRPDDVAYLKKKEKKERNVERYDDILKKKMKEIGTFTERKFWRDCYPSDIEEFPHWYLKKKNSFMTVYREGIFKGVIEL